jgi:acetoin utilization deacetylase AcuC-like enzyme
MRFGYHERCLDHDTGPRHPETADRLEAIRRRLSREHAVEYESAAPADAETLARVHDDAYVAAVEEFCADGGGTWDADTVAVGATWDAACLSAGLAIDACEATLDGTDGRDTPFSLGRPPGHHAVKENAMGFCFFNNAAVAADVALDRPDVDRVAVFDWDVHHGNGTQDLTLDRGDIHYTSFHERGLYPGSGEIEETGEGDGDGMLVNAPLPGGSGDAEYLDATERLLAPALERYDPDLFIVSAGFDAHQHDPISRMRLSTEGYGLLTDRCREIAESTDAALAFVLEGGYGLEALASSVAMVNDVFDGREPVEPDGEPSERATSVVDRTREVHGLD